MTDQHIPGPAEMLQIADDERRRAEDDLIPSDRLLYGVWGGAWALGFAALWLGTGDNARIDAPYAAGAIYATLLATAFVVTILHISRRVAGVHGPSEATGHFQALTWAVAFGAFTLLAIGLERSDASEAIISVYMSALPCFIVGLIFMANGAAWLDRLQFALGATITAVAGTSTLVGVPNHHLVLSIAGGGAFLIAAARAGRPSTT